MHKQGSPPTLPMGESRHPGGSSTLIRDRWQPLCGGEARIGRSEVQAVLLSQGLLLTLLLFYLIEEEEEKENQNGFSGKEESNQRGSARVLLTSSPDPLSVRARITCAHSVCSPLVMMRLLSLSSLLVVVVIVVVVTLPVEVLGQILSILLSLLSLL